MTTPLGASGATSAPSPAATAGTSASAAAGLGQDAFMKLLVAQMKYQDPMAPTDGQQYMTQMATFTQVEKLGQLVTAQAEVAQWQKRLSAEAMVGKQVSGTSAEGAFVTGTVTAVRHTVEGPLLQLSDGARLPLTAVTDVGTPGTTASGTTAPSTTGTPSA